ncbi:hypothetical protein [Deinococcus aestuarii]|uniref:hypothetical protein n=1 Tax=Deinococcus aestuarii TaxID=2774531 RepID=UPI001C0C95D8|nr:hypothetical protein [Deinococcus aestuarii]
MSYLPVHLHQLSSLADGDPVLLTGLYSRHPGGAVLTQGEQRLALIGQPFTALPAQHSRTEVWGVLLQGQVRRLLVHDARPAGSAIPVPGESASGRVGDEIALTVQVRFIGHDQVAVTADRQVYLLWGEDLDQRCYLLTGRVQSLNPPTLSVCQAVPVSLILPPGADAFA